MASLNALLVAGSDTEVGKTVVTSALLAYGHRHHPQRSLAVLKPVQSGVGDGELYQRLFFPQVPLATLMPQAFQAPLAPPLAAALEHRTVDLGQIWQTLTDLTRRHDWVLVEGAGGLGSPVTDEFTLADLAAAWHLPLVLVVPVKLGAIAQAVANVALARQTGLDLRGIILNCAQPLPADQIDQWAPIPLITNLTQVPVLGVMPHLSDPESAPALVAAAQGLILEPLYPRATGVTP
ncbi:MAG: dethiobiotin synthase [Cyanobacteriota bacterium]|jgi:dethiobiotin synthetase|nr:dethiobiotin synthase [Cyanobacteriota bacterium]